MDAKRGWCILRTSPARTSAVTDSLGSAGIDAWTPRETQRRRIHRTKKATEDHVISMAPSFVFVRATSLPDLLRILAMPISQHPQFRLFRFAGRIPVIGDQDIEFLRLAEAKAELRQKRSPRYMYPRCTSVRIDPDAYPAFTGLVGQVKDCTGKQAVISMALFGRPFELKVATWLLRPDGGTNEEPSGVIA